MGLMTGLQQARLRRELEEAKRELAVRDERYSEACSELALELRKVREELDDTRELLNSKLLPAVANSMAGLEVQRLKKRVGKALIEAYEAGANEDQPNGMRGTHVERILKSLMG